MWSMDVCSKVWRWLWKAGSNRSLRDEGPSLPSGSRRWRQLLQSMESISRRFTTPMDQYKERRNDRVFCRIASDRARDDIDDPANGLVGAPRIVGEPFDLYGARD